MTNDKKIFSPFKIGTIVFALGVGFVYYNFTQRIGKLENQLELQIEIDRIHGYNVQSLTNKYEQLQTEFEKYKEKADTNSSYEKMKKAYRPLEKYKETNK